MGATVWSDDHYADRVSMRAAHSIPTFKYDADTSTKHGTSEYKAHESLNPIGKIRESRDSEVHPDSVAIGVIFDVTGSMGVVPSILQINLPKLMGLLLRKGYIKDPQILIGAVGDATANDQVPLQLGQFESGIEIEDNLTNLLIEGGGGGGIQESYQLAMYFMAKRTSIDCFEKRNKRGYLFIIGDELPYATVRKEEILRHIGESVQADIPTSELVIELKKKYDVYFIIPKLTNHYDDPAIYSGWVKYLGQNVLRLDEPSGICEMIASTIAIAEGYDHELVTDDLTTHGSDKNVIKAVSKALTPIAGSKSTVATIPDSGESGITVL